MYFLNSIYKIDKFDTAIFLFVFLVSMVVGPILVAFVDAKYVSLSVFASFFAVAVPIKLAGGYSIAALIYIEYNSLFGSKLSKEEILNNGLVKKSQFGLIFVCSALLGMSIGFLGLSGISDQHKEGYRILYPLSLTCFSLLYFMSLMYMTHVKKQEFSRLKFSLSYLKLGFCYMLIFYILQLIIW